MNTEMKKWIEQGKKVGEKSLLAVKKIPKIFASIKDWICSNPYILRLMKEKPFRILVGLLVGFGISICCGSIIAVVGIMCDLKWFMVVGCYFIVMNVIRVLLLSSHRYHIKQETPEKRNLFEQKAYRMCGVLMFIANVVMTGLWIQMIWWAKSYEYPDFVKYVLIVYAVYVVGMAMKNMIQFWNKKNAICSALKRIDFAMVMMSGLSLHTTFVMRLSDSTVIGTKIMYTLIGLVVGVIMFCMTCSMVINASDEIVRVKSKKCNENDKLEEHSVG